VGFVRSMTPVGAVPQGWDKTYCLRYVKSDFDEIHFFGDKTHEVGWIMEEVCGCVMCLRCCLPAAGGP
jgi:hypothetical protein